MKDTSPERSIENDSIPPAESIVSPKRSTLIEFPGSNRASRPQWRQQLSERVREIQERKAREGETVPGTESATRTSSGTTLGVVAPTPAADVNPIVEAALKRLERAKQPQAPYGRTMGGGRGSAAVARAAEEEIQEISLGRAELPEAEEQKPQREHKLTVVAPTVVAPAVAPPADVPAVIAAPIVESPKPVPLPEVPINRTQSAQTAVVPEKKIPRKVFDAVVDDAYLSRLEKELLPPVVEYEPLENFGSIPKRLVAAAVDFGVVIFASSPFAAIIELTNSNWFDIRVQGSMAGIFVLIMFLYQTASIGLSGRTLGMSLVSLRSVDSRTGVHPTALQSMLRGFSFVVVAATGFLGAMPSLFDGEKRCVHDMISRTVIVAD
jgi:hypothetical protein